jgi:hypothetical protein
MYPKNPLFKKNKNKNIFDHLFEPFKNETFLLVLRIFQGVRKYFFFIQNGANFAHPLGCSV